MDDATHGGHAAGAPDVAPATSALAEYWGDSFELDVANHPWGPWTAPSRYRPNVLGFTWRTPRPNRHRRLVRRRPYVR